MAPINNYSIFCHSVSSVASALLLYCICYLRVQEFLCGLETRVDKKINESLERKQKDLQVIIPLVQCATAARLQ